MDGVHAHFCKWLVIIGLYFLQLAYGVHFSKMYTIALFLFFGFED